jgi:hypothetical protein
MRCVAAHFLLFSSLLPVVAQFAPGYYLPGWLPNQPPAVTTLPFSLAAPSALARDAARNTTYIASLGGTRVFRVAPNGTLSAWAGSAWAGSNDGALTAAAATLANPTGVACDGAGTCYVTEFLAATSALRLRAINTTSLAVRSIPLSPAAGITIAAHIAWESATGGSLLLSATGVGQGLYRAYPNGSTFLLVGGGASGFANGVGGSAQFRQIWSMCADPLQQGRIVVMEHPNYPRLRNISTRAPLHALYTAEAGYLAGGGATVATLNPTPGCVEGVGTNALFNGLLTCAFSPVAAGQFYVADSANHRIRSVHYDTLAVSTLSGGNGGACVGAAGTVDGSATVAQFSSPSALAIDSAGGALFVLDLCASQRCALLRRLLRRRVGRLLPHGRRRRERGAVRLLHRL